MCVCVWCNVVNKKETSTEPQGKVPSVLDNNLPRAVSVVGIPSFQLAASGSLACQGHSVLLTH